MPAPVSPDDCHADSDEEDQVATFGQWLTGGHYALAPLTWLFVGWLTARAASTGEPEPEEAPAPVRASLPKPAVRLG